MKKPVFIIEHLEKGISKWSLIEYKNISSFIGKNNLWFTNIKRKNKSLERYGKIIKNPVKSLSLKNACLLDPASPKTLSPKEAKKFSFFIFGGILGDYPPKKRTKKELTPFLPEAETRNLGKKQFATDNAVFIVKEILKGKSISSLKFKNKITIKINDIESIILPFKYCLVNNKPLISKEIISYLKRKKGF